MNKITTILLCLLLLAACGAGGEEPVEVAINTSGLLDNPSVGSTPPGEPAAAGMTITWGYCNIPVQHEHSNTNLPDDSKVIQYLNNYFNVVLKGISIPFENEKYYGNWEAAANLPDIFVVSGDSKYAYETGLFRTVPRMMVERYAPRYAALLYSEPGAWDLNRAHEPDEYLGLLSSYSPSDSQLIYYSVYRLDWLEEAGLEPPGELIPVGSNGRVFFSETAFNLEGFMRALRAFDAMGKNQGNIMHPYSLTIPRSNSLESVFGHDITTLAGMWGLGPYNINENNRATMYYASERYRDFVIFLKDLYDSEYLGIYGNKVVNHADGTVTGTIGGSASGSGKGWWVEWTDGIVDAQAWWMEHRQVLNNSGAKILITPPEKGLNFQGAVGSPGAGASFSADMNIFMVHTSVTDDKLAKILEIYDTMAFDPELAVIGMFGFEGEDFKWTGEPYDSFVHRYAFDEENFEWSMAMGPIEDIMPFNSGVNLLYPRIMDGHARKESYFKDIDKESPVYRHATSAPARAMILQPYKADIAGMFTDELAAFEENYSTAALDEIAARYFFDILTGEMDIHNTWDTYIEKLNDNGLQMYHEIINQFPIVGR